MPKLTLDEAVNIRTDYLSNLSVTAISDKYKISTDKVKKVLTSEDETARRLAEEGIQVKLQVQTTAIMKAITESTTFLTEAISSARKSDQPHLFIDKVASAIEKFDKIARLNMNRATEIKETRSTHTRMDVAKVIEQLDTPEKQEDFLRKQIPQKYDRNKKDIGKPATTFINQTP